MYFIFTGTEIRPAVRYIVNGNYNSGFPESTQ